MKSSGPGSDRRPLARGEGRMGPGSWVQNDRGQGGLCTLPSPFYPFSTVRRNLYSFLSSIFLRKCRNSKTSRPTWSHAISVPLQCGHSAHPRANFCPREACSPGPPPPFPSIDWVTILSGRGASRGAQRVCGAGLDPRRPSCRGLTAAGPGPPCPYLKTPVPGSDSVLQVEKPNVEEPRTGRLRRRPPASQAHDVGAEGEEKSGLGRLGFAACPQNLSTIRYPIAVPRIRFAPHREAFAKW
jgi:hypothetical protein